MKKLLLLFGIIVFGVVSVSAQTKKVAHASHSGKTTSLRYEKEDNLGNPYPSTITVPIKTASGKIIYKQVPYRDRHKYIKPEKPKPILKDSSCTKPKSSQK